jgi:hypothetical protein
MGRPRQNTPEELAAAISLWDRGELSARQVSLVLSMSYWVVRRALREAGRDLGGERRIPRGSDHWSWKGGTYVNNRGYVMVTINDDAFASMAISSSTRRGRRQCLEHRLVMAEHIGRPLTPNEHVHHKDGNRTNNVIDNLQLRLVPHGPGAIFECCDCGSRNVSAPA